MSICPFSSLYVSIVKSDIHSKYSLVFLSPLIKSCKHAGYVGGPPSVFMLCMRHMKLDTIQSSPPVLPHFSHSCRH